MAKVLKITALVGLVAGLIFSAQMAYAQTQSGSVGIDGRVGAAPPSVGATISQPANGSSFNDSTITVRGICSGDVLVKLFKNNVFAGSAQCLNGSFSLQMDLFSGKNDLVAKVYDALDQAGPDSNTVSVTYIDPAAGVTSVSRPTITSEYAKRGANPNTILEWPVTISGGSAPYAVSVDWGDGATSLYSVGSPGQTVLQHTYKTAGAYRVVIKAVDAAGNSAYLQVVAIANGQVTQAASNGSNNSTTVQVRYIVLWLPILILALAALLAFWLGRRFELRLIRSRINRHESTPFQ